MIEPQVRNRVLKMLSEEFGPSIILALSGVELKNNGGQLDIGDFLNLYVETGHQTPPYISEDAKKNRVVIAISRLTKALLDDFRIEMIKNGIPLRYYDDIILYLLSNVCISGCSKKYIYNLSYLLGEPIGGDEI